MKLQVVYSDGTPTAEAINLDTGAVLPFTLAEVVAGVWATNFAGPAGTYATVYYDGTTAIGADPVFGWDGSAPVGSTVDLSPVLAAVADVQSAVAGLQGIAVDQSNPVAPNGTLTLQRGDDYPHDEGISPVWNLTSGPDLTGGSVALVFTRGRETVLRTQGVVSSASSCYVELAAAQTRQLAGVLDYQLVATLADGHVITIQTGTAVIEPL